MTQKNKTSTYTKGMEIRRLVLGNKHVENAIKNTNKIDEKTAKMTETVTKLKQFFELLWKESDFMTRKICCVVSCFIVN